MQHFGPDEKANVAFKRVLGTTAAALRFTWTLVSPDGVSTREESFAFDEVAEVQAQSKDVVSAALDLLFSYARQMRSKDCSPRIIYVSTGDNLSTMLVQVSDSS